MTTFDLAWMQVMTGGTEVIESEISADIALARLNEHNKDASNYGMGSVFYLTPSDDPLHQVRKELVRAAQLHPPMNSAHEAYAVILEELDEFKAEVFKKTAERDTGAMRTELIQLAAMALRAIDNLNL